MGLLFYIVVFGVGYFFRHIDVLRLHGAVDPMAAAIKSAQKAHEAQVQADLVARLMPAKPAPVAQTSPPATPPV